jgi:DNA-binding response OmpR family regulator
MAKRRETRTILIIEDEAEVRNFAARVCELEGYQVLQAEDSDTGLKLVRENRVALVLLDLKLPRGDGWAVLKSIKSDPELYTVPVVVFSASAAISQRAKASSMGAADYLVKPVSALSLKKAVSGILRRKGRL